MRTVAIHQRSLNLIIFHLYDPIDIQEGGAEFIGYKIVILSNPTPSHCQSEVQIVSEAGKELPSRFGDQQ